MLTKFFNLEKHLKEEHRMTPLSTYLKEVVYGGTDGIVTTFSVVAGFTGAQQNTIGILPLATVLLFGFANLFGDGVSMALGNFLSSRSEQDVYHKFKTKEREEIRKNPEIERAESIEILIRRGFNTKQAEKLVDLMSQNENYFLDFMMHDELQLPNTENDKTHLMVLATFAAFISFGLIPLLPYIFFKNDPDLFLFSVLTTGLALVLLGFLRYYVTGYRWMKSVLETLFLGSAAAVVSYFVGTLFRI